MLFGEKGTVTTNKSNLNIREDDMLIFLLALLVMAVLLLKAIIPIAIVLLKFTACFSKTYPCLYHEQSL